MVLLTYTDSMPKLLLFDADGVLTIPEELFSVVYCKSHGLDPQPLEAFFKAEWHDYVTGKKDLVDHITKNPELGQWYGSAEELVQYWCKIEDIRNETMISLVKEIRKKGIPCYLATEQEHYRGRYMKEVMFKDLFDGYFISSEVGFKKSDPAFFNRVIQTLQSLYSNLKAEDILFFDDSQSKVDAASRTGINATLFTGEASVLSKLKSEKINC